MPWVAKWMTAATRTRTAMPPTIEQAMMTVPMLSVLKSSAHWNTREGKCPGLVCDYVWRNAAL